VRAGIGLVPIAAFVFLAASLLAPGIFFLVQRETGTRASATVAECKTTGAGKYADTHCTGSWTVGGSLIDGGHVVVGTISGVDQRDVGKVVDVTLRGDTAYSRSLTGPLLLIGLGLIPTAGAVFVVVAMVRRRHST
jgi:hypothetical protein